MMQAFNHKHIIVNAAVKNPPTTVEAMSAWLLDTVNAVDMKVLMGPHCVRCETDGNVGVTGAVVIETSHMTAHSWEEADVPFVNMDLYSCADFEASAFIDMVKKHFDPYYVRYMVVDRNTTRTRKLIVLENTSVQVIPILDLLSDEDRFYFEDSRGLYVEYLTSHHLQAIQRYIELSNKYGFHDE